ncbi:MAG: phospholipase D-like domain-containing protein [Bacteroidota bacterium]
MSNWFKVHPFRKNCSVRMLRSGNEYFDRLFALINEAKHSIHIQFYIFDADETGFKTLHLLKQAAERGVKVLLVVDGYASDKLTYKHIEELKHPNLLFKRFAPVKTTRFRIGRRMHHKVVLVDEHTALIGGINIANKYSGFGGQIPWLDFAVEVRGMVCKDIKRICDSVWPRHLIRKLWKQLPRTTYSDAGRITVKLLQNDWWRRRVEISGFYREAIAESQSEILLVASYFFPGYRLRRQLLLARKRGVNIKLLLAGQSDVMLVKPATTYLYDWLLRNGIELYEWQPSIMHGKLAVFDKKVCSVGSYNMNELSDYGSIELNVLIETEQFSIDLLRKVEGLMEGNTRKISKANFSHSTLFYVRFYRWFSYQLIRLSLKILFAFMQRAKNPQH